MAHHRFENLAAANQWRHQKHQNGEKRKPNE